MSIYETYKEQADALIAAGSFFNQRNWAPATSGNYSSRLGDDALPLTVSGAHKGELSGDDFLVVDGRGVVVETPREGAKPSAETGLHTQIYRLDPGVGAVLHSHSVISTVVSRHCAGDALVFEGYEMQKAFRGISTHDCRVEVPVFENDQDIARLAEAVEEYVQAHGLQVGYLIRGHGLYSWGATVFEARRQVEALEFLLECEWMRSGGGRAE